jgi:hypothetical protein
VAFSFLAREGGVIVRIGVMALMASGAKALAYAESRN